MIAERGTVTARQASFQRPFASRNEPEDRMSSSTGVAAHRARAFQAGTFDLSFGSPPAWQSALREYRERQPRRPPSKAIAIHESTDGPAILRRVFSEPIEPDTDDLRDEVA